MDRKQAVVLAVMAAVILILTGFIIIKELNGNKEAGLSVVQDDSDEYSEPYDIFEDSVKDNEEEKNDVDATKKIKVYIVGQVKNPGVVEVDMGSRLEDVVKEAGGLLEDADLLRINLAIRVKDEGMYIIPKEGEPLGEGMGIDGPSKAESDDEDGKININTADETQLQQLPRIGPVLAKAIVEYREKNGPFKRIEDIKNVSGIGVKTFEQLKELITIE